MLSVIIPTMQKNTKILLNLLKNVSQDKVVDEIILIDNTGKGFSENILNIEKVRPIINIENKYVNPTWNQGVELVKNEYWALLNDDILISNDFCSNVINKMNSKMGIVGVGTEFVKTLNPELLEDIELTSTKHLTLEKTNVRCGYFGIAMFGNIKNYYKIPEDLLIYCGDDYLFRMNKKYRKTNYIITNVTVYHMHSMTSSIPKFLNINLNDIMLFDKYYIEKTFTLKQKLFTMRTMYYDNKKHKVLFLLGKKFVLNSKPVTFDTTIGRWF